MTNALMMGDSGNESVVLCFTNYISTRSLVKLFFLHIRMYFKLLQEHTIIDLSPSLCITLLLFVAPCRY
jgi:hypothetical protein